MKKSKVLLSVIVVFTLFSLFSLIYAFSNVNMEENTVSKSENNSIEIQPCISKSEKELTSEEKQEVILVADTYASTLVSSNEIQTLSTLQDTSDEIIVLYDNIIDEEYYEIKKKDYCIGIAEDLTLREFTDNTFDYDLATTATKIEAKNFIVSFYNNLNVSHDYELAYLEPADDGIWEADFAKKVDGIYNYYDSIKIFFSPEQEKIAALRVHSTEYVASENSTMATSYSTKSNSSENICISELEAKDAVKASFPEINYNDIKEMELVFTKPNDFFTGEYGTGINFENIVVKAWKVTVEKDSQITFVYVDSITGDVVGGGQLK